MIFILPELWWWRNLLGYHIGFPMQEQELFANIWMQFILEVINKGKMNCSWRKVDQTRKSWIKWIFIRKEIQPLDHVERSAHPTVKRCLWRFFLQVFAGKRNFCKETFLFGIVTGNIETILLAGWPLKGKVFINLKVKVCKFIGRKIENRGGFLLTKVRSLDKFFSPLD